MPNAKMNCFVDTNLLIYSLDPQAPAKRAIAEDLLTTLADFDALVLSPQSLNECYRALTERRRLLPIAEARNYVTNLQKFCVAPYDFDVTQLAWRIQDETRYSWWDCMLVASACLAQCEVFFSEDLQRGRRLGPLTIVNPFTDRPNFIRAD